MATLIDAEERTIEDLFSVQNPYKLDVYQRDYRWSDDGEYKIVTQLLDDLWLHFEHNMKTFRKSQSDVYVDICDDVEKNFRAYFLNTIMLNKPEDDNNIYIVDGQQRFTTLLLILIKLYHIGKAQNIKSPDINVDKILGDKIYNEDRAGRKSFRISNDDRNKIINKIFLQEVIDKNDIDTITKANIKKNYDIISKFFDRMFGTAENFDKTLYQYYCVYLTIDVLILEQSIKRKEDVAMIFETANDRGKELEPHEVLKGMLLGVLNVNIKEECNNIWNEALQKFFIADGKSYTLVDEFFRTYFRAKYADSQGQYDSFANKYNRSLLSNEKIIKDIDRTKPSTIERFIKNEFLYYYRIYLELIDKAKNDKNIYLSSNYANDLDRQYLLILSALTLNDPEKEIKIDLVARKYDQFFTLFHLTCIYNNNKMQDMAMKLVVALRNKPWSKISDAFDSCVIPFLNEQNSSLKLNCLNDIFDYRNFKNSKRDGRFANYILARIDRYLDDLLHKGGTNAKSFNLYDLVHSSDKRRSDNFQIEHMYAMNEKIMNQFVDADGKHDPQLFEQQRNRLGALLLMKGSLNDSISNGIYREKINEYKASGFIWNEILTGVVPQVFFNNCNDSIKDKLQSQHYEPDADGLLPISVIDERQQLLYEIIERIYKF